MTDHVLVDYSDNVAWITFNRPEARNAISQEMRLAVNEILVDIEQDESVIERGERPVRFLAVVGNVDDVRGLRERPGDGLGQHAIVFDEEDTQSTLPGPTLSRPAGVRRSWRVRSFASGNHAPVLSRQLPRVK